MILFFHFLYSMSQTISVTKWSDTCSFLHIFDYWCVCWHVHIPSHTSNGKDCGMSQRGSKKGDQTPLATTRFFRTNEHKNPNESKHSQQWLHNMDMWWYKNVWYILFCVRTISTGVVEPELKWDSGAGVFL